MRRCNSVSRHIYLSSGSVADGEVEASEELKTALQTTIKELSKAINQIVDEESIQK